jgi:hypothetical protein
MTIGITINGKNQILPGVYSSLSIENSIANPLPGPRNIMLLGEATSGAPGINLNLQQAYFTNFADVKSYYGSGPLVDAAHMIFTQQPAAAFTGSVNRVYCYKTNQSLQAARSVSQLVNNVSTPYGNIYSMAQGTSGNLISAQVVQGNPVTYPSFSAYWLMRTFPITINISASGSLLSSVNIPTESRPQDVVTTLNAINGITASGGGLYEILGPDQMPVTATTATGRPGTATSSGTSWPARVGISTNTISGQVVITPYTSTNGTVYNAGVFTGSDISSVNLGDILYIPVSSTINGATGNVGNANSCYSIISISASSIVANKITSPLSTPVTVAPAANTSPAGSQQLVSAALFMIYKPITLTSSIAPLNGAGLSLEINDSAGSTSLGERLLSNSSFLSPVSVTTAAGASVALSVSIANNITTGMFSISGGSWQNAPAAGSVLWIGRNSLLSGANIANIGAWIVTSSGSSVITAVKCYTGGAGFQSVSIPSVALNGITNPFDIQPAICTTIYASNLLLPAFEPTVYVNASRQSDGAVFPNTQVGGRVVLELGYAGTSATVSIANNILTTTVVGGAGSSISGINLAAYRSIGDLIKFINTQTGYVARVSNNKYLSLSPSVVIDDVTSVGICCGTLNGSQSYPGRLKADQYDFVNLFTLNSGLLGFTPSPAVSKYAGLPSVDANAVFLSGGIQGATGNIDISNGLDRGLQIDVSQVIPLFSRDATYDISDSLTDPNSSYTIASVVSLLTAHVNLASNVDTRRERIGLASHHGDFISTQQLASSIGAPRISMFFEMVNAVGADGNLYWYLPWMGACMVAAGRVQANIGTSMLRKTFACTAIKHPGNVSIYSPLLTNDFNPDSKTDAESAIQSGLIFLRSVAGSGQRMESPDASTYVSASNDPKEWYLARTNVIFATDEVVRTCRATADNYIGETTITVSPAVLRKSLADTLQGFVSQGALKGYQIQSITSLGNGYNVAIRILPVEAVEFIALNFTAGRDLGQ